ncbi:hypothetical protein [Arthrobacter subterraneus]|uniref:hypothetical protein n=1 Tax=Arthrobacter subterraneus TaxID=335973 RepID=UPI00381F2AF7
MGSGFNFNGKDFEKQVMKAAESGIRDLTKQYDRMFDSLRRQYTGRPVNEIKPVLQREWRRVNGGSISDPELTNYASLISEGTPIRMNVRM